MPRSTTSQQLTKFINGTYMRTRQVVGVWLENMNFTLVRQNHVQNYTRLASESDVERILAEY